MSNLRKQTRILVSVFALLMGMFFLGGGPLEAAKNREVVITVSRHGFNGARDYVLEVNEGETITIVFRYGDNDLSENNPHRMVIRGVNEKSAVIDESNPETVMVFTAANVGEMRLICFIPCTGMKNLTSAIIRVKKMPSSAE